MNAFLVTKNNIVDLLSRYHDLDTFPHNICVIEPKTNSQDVLLCPKDLFKMVDDLYEKEAKKCRKELKRGSLFEKPSPFHFPLFVIREFLYNECLIVEKNYCFLTRANEEKLKKMLKVCEVFNWFDHQLVILKSATNISKFDWLT